MSDPLDRARLTALELMRDGVLVKCSPEEFDDWLIACADACKFSSDSMANVIHLTVRAVGYLLAERDDLVGQVARLTKERDDYKTLASVGPWHKDCRPNRRKAIDEIAKSQKLIDNLAEQVTTLRGEVARLTQALEWQLSWLSSFSMPPTSTIEEKQQAMARLSAALRVATEETTNQ